MDCRVVFQRRSVLFRGTVANRQGHPPDRHRCILPAGGGPAALKEIAFKEIKIRQTGSNQLRISRAASSGAEGCCVAAYGRGRGGRRRVAVASPGIPEQQAAGGHLGANANHHQPPRQPMPNSVRKR